MRRTTILLFIKLLISSQLINASLVAHWTLDRGFGSSALDSSGNQQGTVAISNCSWQKDSLVFNGKDSFLTAQSYKGISGAADRTCSIWIKTSSTQLNSGLIAWGDPVKSGAKHVLRLSSGKARFEVVGDGIDGNIAVNDGKWHHIALTVKNSFATIFIDGKKDISSRLPINTKKSQDVWVGRNFQQLKGFFDGIIKDVRIYDHAMSSTEISELFSTSGLLVGHWEFSGQKNKIISDISGHKKDIKLNGCYLSHESTLFNGVSDYATIPRYKGICGDADRTVTALIRSRSNGIQPIIFWGSNTQGRSISILIKHGKLSFDSGAGNYITGKETINDGEWHHITFMYFNNRVKLFVDGVLDAFSNDNIFLNTAVKSDILIGRNPYSKRHFKGEIKELCLFHKGMGDLKIKKLAQWSSPSQSGEIKALICGNTVSWKVNDEAQIKLYQVTCRKSGEVLETFIPDTGVYSTTIPEATEIELTVFKKNGSSNKATLEYRR